MSDERRLVEVLYSDGRAGTTSEGTLEEVLIDLLAFEDGCPVIVHSPTLLEVYNTWRE